MSHNRPDSISIQNLIANLKLIKEKQNEILDQEKLNRTKSIDELNQKILELEEEKNKLSSQTFENEKQLHMIRRFEQLTKPFNIDDNGRTNIYCRNKNQDVPCDVDHLLEMLQGDNSSDYSFLVGDETIPTNFNGFISHIDHDDHESQPEPDHNIVSDPATNNDNDDLSSVPEIYNPSVRGRIQQFEQLNNPYDDQYDYSDNEDGY